MKPGWLPLAVVALASGLACSPCLAQDAKPWEKPGTKVGEEIIGPDGGKMVWVPAGAFTMGSQDPNWANPAYREWTVPIHHVNISRGFWLGKCTVRNSQYRQYCRETGAGFPKSSDQGDLHPVMHVNWFDAKAYCVHYGMTLPTEAQWEYAARGPEGRKYPWGNDWNKAKCCNINNQGPGGTTFPVGNFPQGASWCGALDMAGNVWQWCGDWFSEDYYRHSTVDDPGGPPTGENRVVRGGSWVSYGDYCRSASRYRASPIYRSDIGFRCVVYPRRTSSAARQCDELWEKSGTRVGEEIIGPDGGKMVWVPAGEFVMGSREDDEDARPGEHPAHQVRITKGFWLGKYTVTNAQYRRYCQKTGAEFPEDSDQGDDHPVVCEEWSEAKAYCQHYGLSLPTEAQWEYAARGPEGRKYPWGNRWDPKRCASDANQRPKGRTFPVGSFPQGASWCGALDMAGNVWQWCQDWYSDSYYPNSPRIDPPGPETGEARVLRGGSWTIDPHDCRSASRYSYGPLSRDSYDNGFRCLRTP